MFSENALCTDVVEDEEEEQYTFDTVVRLRGDERKKVGTEFPCFVQFDMGANPFATWPYSGSYLEMHMSLNLSIPKKDLSILSTSIMLLSLVF